MRVLIAVASKHGSTREIASVIANELRAENLTVELREAIEVGDVIGYDAVLLGSAIYAGKWLSEAQRFAAQHQVELSTVPVWLFSSGPLGTDDPQPQDDPDLLATPLGDVKPQDHRVFTGKLDLARLGFGERLLTKVVSAPSGDFRDWEEIRAWAQKVANEICAEGALANR